MAACGLQPGRKGSIPGHNGFGDTRYSRNSTSIGIHNDKSMFELTRHNRVYFPNE